MLMGANVHVCVHIRGFSQELYMYVSVYMCAASECVSVYVAVSVALKSHHTDRLLR